MMTIYSCSVHGLEPAVQLAQSVEHCASVTAVLGSGPTLGALFPPMLRHSSFDLI